MDQHPSPSTPDPLKMGLSIGNTAFQLTEGIRQRLENHFSTKGQEKPPLQHQTLVAFLGGCQPIEIISAHVTNIRLANEYIPNFISVSLGFPIYLSHAAQPAHLFGELRNGVLILQAFFGSEVDDCFGKQLHLLQVLGLEFLEGVELENQGEIRGKQLSLGVGFGKCWDEKSEP